MSTFSPGPAPLLTHKGGGLFEGCPRCRQWVNFVDSATGICLDCWRPQAALTDPLIAAAPRMLELLRKVEHVFDPHAGAAFCPVCGSPEALGMNDPHAPGCELDALLKEFM